MTDFGIFYLGVFFLLLGLLKQSWALGNGMVSSGAQARVKSWYIYWGLPNVEYEPFKSDEHTWGVQQKYESQNWFICEGIWLGLRPNGTFPRRAWTTP